LAGLWEFPGERVVESSKQGSIVLAYERFFRETLGIDVGESKPCMTIQHVFTHFKMTLHVFLYHSGKQVKVGLPLLWLERETLSARPFSSAHQKIVLQLTQKQHQGELFQ